LTYEDGLREATQIARELLEPERKELSQTQAFHAGADWALRSLVDVLNRRLIASQLLTLFGGQ